MREKKNSYLFILILVILAVAVVIGIIKTTGTTPKFVAMEANPERIMGTECRIVAVATPKKAAKKKDALAGVEQVLRDIEAKMSTYLEDSEISLLNKAMTNQKVTISESTVEVLELSKKIYTQSDGAFDITVKPLVTLWKNAGKENKLPSEDEIATARAISYIGSISIDGDTAWKDSDTTSVDLGGIAKGYAADKGLEKLQKADFNGGFVDLGGDIKCFGHAPSFDKWDVIVADPFEQTHKQALMTLFITDKSVCTSGNYQRFSTIDGKNYSHIIDPRTGYPADAVPSATVIADNAAVADAWATALSVLGVDGFDYLPKADGIDAMIVTGSSDNFKIHMTAGFAAYIKEKLPDGWEVEIIQ
jgi:thiamine biosynthesis lipoprotein